MSKNKPENFCNCGSDLPPFNPECGKGTDNDKTFLIENDKKAGKINMYLVQLDEGETAEEFLKSDNWKDRATLCEIDPDSLKPEITEHEDGSFSVPASINLRMK